MPSLIDNLSDTARWVAIFRAEESERDDAIFHDRFARKLAGKRGEEIANAIEFTRKNSWSLVARTYLFDDYITRCIWENYDMVINLAAGLDARPYRMDIPQNTHWIEVDMPGILQYKEDILKDEKPVCHLQRIPLDLADQKVRLELFEQLGKIASRALVICEGLLIYLTAGQVASLAADLSAQKSFKRWAFDLQSPGLLALAQKEMGAKLDSEKQLFQFAPENGELFFHDYGWKLIETRSKLKTAAMLNRLSGDILAFADYPEPEGPKGDFPWAGVCLMENVNA